MVYEMFLWSQMCWNKLYCLPIYIEKLTQIFKKWVIQLIFTLKWYGFTDQIQGKLACYDIEKKIAEKYTKILEHMYFNELLIK